jgi:general secretion pathway protein D
VQNLRTGFVLDIEAVTSSDRRYVSMTVQFAQNILIGFDSQEVQGAAGGGDFGRSSQFNATIQLPNVAVTQINTAVSCPDKGTILLGGRRDVNETEIEVGVPVLSKVPFVNRFFTNSVTSKLETTTLLLIRPEIIIQAEAEDLLFPGLSDQLSGSSKGAGY